MDRHIDLDSAMINHLEGLGYKITGPDGSEDDGPRHDIPELMMLAISRAEEADGQYADAWDCLSHNALAEIIIMKGNRALAGVDNDDYKVVVDSLVDIVNYACKLYTEFSIGEDK